MIKLMITLNDEKEDVKMGRKIIDWGKVKSNKMLELIIDNTTQLYFKNSIKKVDSIINYR